MKKTARKGPKRTAPTALPLLHAIVRRDLREFVVDAGMAALADVLEQERAAACGPRYAHQPERHALTPKPDIYRGGYVRGLESLLGKWVTSSGLSYVSNTFNATDLADAAI